MRPRSDTPYGQLGLDAAGLVTPDGTRHPVGELHARHLAELAVELTGGRESIVWVHESAEEAAETWRAHGRPIGDGGWVALDHLAARKVHLASVAQSGDLAGLRGAQELVLAAEVLRDALGGFQYLSSGAATIHKLIALEWGRNAGAADQPPDVDGWADTAYRTPAYSWVAPAIPEGGEWIRVYDRNGSYLSAWSGLNLASGRWAHFDRPLLADPGQESQRFPGYWRVDLRPVHRHLGDGPDPFRRAGRDTEGPVWLTTPLLQLATEIAGPLEVAEAWLSDDRCRALDEPARRLSQARTFLIGLGTPEAAAALRVLKDGYSRAVAWFEWGPPEGQLLHRPYWRRALTERYCANTWRAMRDAASRVVAWGEVDAVAFVVNDIYETPPGLRVGERLGSWKPKGHPVPVKVARRVWDAGGGGIRALVDLAQS